MRGAWRLEWKKGVAKLEKLAQWLDQDHSDAAASLREGWKSASPSTAWTFPTACRGFFYELDEESVIFGDLFEEYRDKVCITYMKKRDLYSSTAEVVTVECLTMRAPSDGQEGAAATSLASPGLRRSRAL